MVYLHFWYLDFVRVVLPAEIVPRSRPRGVWVRVRVGRRRGNQSTALHLRLSVALLQLQLQRLMVYHCTAFEDNGGSSGRSTGTQFRVVEGGLHEKKETTFPSVSNSLTYNRTRDSEISDKLGNWTTDLPSLTPRTFPIPLLASVYSIIAGRRIEITHLRNLPRNADKRSRSFPQLLILNRWGRTTADCITTAASYHALTKFH